MWTLWLLLLALPFAVLASGALMLLRSWSRDVPHEARQSLATMVPAPLATLLVAGTTLTICRYFGDCRDAHARELTASYTE
jgi:ABC-type Fe3+ transport system permease subunit